MLAMLESSYFEKPKTLRKKRLLVVEGMEVVVGIAVVVLAWP